MKYIIFCNARNRKSWNSTSWSLQIFVFAWKHLNWSIVKSSCQLNLSTDKLNHQLIVSVLKQCVQSVLWSISVVLYGICRSGIQLLYYCYSLLYERSTFNQRTAIHRLLACFLQDAQYGQGYGQQGGPTSFSNQMWTDSKQVSHTGSQSCRSLSDWSVNLIHSSFFLVSWLVTSLLLDILNGKGAFNIYSYHGNIMSNACQVSIIYI